MKKNSDQKIKSNMSASEETLLTLIRTLLPDENDFERMLDSGVTYIQDMDYDIFVQNNVTAANMLMEYYPEDATFFKDLLKRICLRQINTLDMESGSIFKGTTAYFDENMQIVIVTPR